MPTHHPFSATFLTKFQEKLLQWYKENARPMPWRSTKDPYKIWLSEVMLQQTRVDQALPYYERFVAAFPTMATFAHAPIDKILRHWEGLGYYARARNLHKAMNTVVNELGGIIPNDLKSIKKLKGIGDYTAAALLSIIYNKPHAVVDGNVIRVITRLYSLEKDISLSSTKKEIQAIADFLLEKSVPGTFNQAMMELGATCCTPTQPNCTRCPVQEFCTAFKTNSQTRFPHRTPKAKTPHYQVSVGIIYNSNGEILINQRPENGLLGGLWEFPGGKQEQNESLETTCKREVKEELGIDVEPFKHLASVRHAYTHFKITLHAYCCKLIAGSPQSTNGCPVKWIKESEFDQYAFPRANRKIIEKLKLLEQSPSLFD